MNLDEWPIKQAAPPVDNTPVNIDEVPISKPMDFDELLAQKMAQEGEQALTE